MHDCFVLHAVLAARLPPHKLAGSLVLPSGQVAMMNARMMQVVNPYTGDALASAPPLPEGVKDLTWE
jgi:hypothetical protein